MTREGGPTTPQPAPGRVALRIPVDIHAAMVYHCRLESPLECCGILGGKDNTVDSFHPLRNVAESGTTRYDAAPDDLIRTVVWLRECGSEMLAIYHSHPRWTAVPSQTDLRTNYYGPLPRIIISLLAEPPEVRVWRLETESFAELAWDLIKSGEAGAASSRRRRGGAKG